MYWSHAEINRSRSLLGVSAKASFPISINAFERRVLKYFQDRFVYAGIPEQQAIKELSRVVFFILLVLVLGLSLQRVFLSFVFVGVGVGAWYWLLNKRAIRRALSFEHDYPAMLVSFASGVRTGKDPLEAFLGLQSLFDSTSALYKEIEKVKAAVESGSSEEGAIKIFGTTILHPDISLLRTAYILAQREGASLAPCLQRLTKVTRNRQSFRRKTRSAIALQKLSAFGIVLCCGVIGAMQIFVNPQAIQNAFAHPFGQKILIAGIGVMSTGLFWMIRIGRVRL